MVSRTLALFASKRVPLIKFRKGGYAHSDATSVAAANQASSSSPGSATTNVTNTAPSAAIEDWELPPRYWRKPIDTVEMEYINRGGPA